MIKKLFALFVVVLISNTAFSQKKVKVKGSRVISVENTPINSFERLLLQENFEVKLVQAEEASVEITTDDNLHEFIKIETQDSTLTLATTRKITSKKALEITIFYTDILNTIEVEDNAEVFSEEKLEFDDLTLSTSESAKAELTLECDLFRLINADKSKLKLNITAKDAVIELNDNSKVEALINASTIDVDAVQRASAKIEGDAEELKIKTDNSTNFDGSNLSGKDVLVITEDRARVKTNAKQDLIIEASGTSEVEIYGSPKINIEKFEGNAVLKRK